ncbi:MAG: type II toxin-antitoxin system RelE/ParE family toxin [Cyclobacteriaceae bacterium]
MERAIEWSPKASSEYLRLVDYLLSEWGSGTATRFIDRLSFILDIIIKQPEIYPSTLKRKNVRRCVVTKQVSLYYRVAKDKIELIAIYDNRIDPSKKQL